MKGRSVASSTRASAHARCARRTHNKNSACTLRQHLPFADARGRRVAVVDQEEKRVAERRAGWRLKNLFRETGRDSRPVLTARIIRRAAADSEIFSAARKPSLLLSRPLPEPSSLTPGLRFTRKRALHAWHARAIVLSALEGSESSRPRSAVARSVGGRVFLAAPLGLPSLRRRRGVRCKRCA